MEIKQYLHKKIAFIGIGSMGKGMAKNLLKAGFALHIWDINSQHMHPLVEMGAKASASLAATLENADIIISMLPHGDAVTDVYFDKGNASLSADNALFINMGTIDPNLSIEHARKIEKLGRRHVDAPVSGGALGAEEGSLAIFVGCNKNDFEEASFILSHLGNVNYLGGHGKCQICKLCNNIFAFQSVYAMVEAICLAEKSNLEPQLFLKAIKGGVADIPAIRIWGQKVLDKDWETTQAPNKLLLKGVMTESCV